MMPAWFSWLATIYLGLSLLVALYVLADIFLFGHRQKMAVMEVVWPLTMLYAGPIGLWFYHRIGRASVGDRPFWHSAFLGATHCGAGCALGDAIGDPLVFAAGWTVLGSRLLAIYLVTFVLAYVLGIGFQYFAIAPVRNNWGASAIVAAIESDSASLVAYQIGMFAVMGARSAFLPDIEPRDPSYWLIMQVAMMAGFLTTLPVNAWLIRKGIKEKM
jgi:hypothetical protein